MQSSDHTMKETEENSVTLAGATLQKNMPDRLCTLLPICPVSLVVKEGFFLCIISAAEWVQFLSD